MEATVSETTPSSVGGSILPRRKSPETPVTEAGIEMAQGECNLNETIAERRRKEAAVIAEAEKQLERAKKKGYNPHGHDN